jgi:hypothetical protein
MVSHYSKAGERKAIERKAIESKSIERKASDAPEGYLSKGCGCCDW